MPDTIAVGEIISPSLAEADYCPNCSADLLGEPIPKEYQKSHYGGATHYRQVMGIEYGYASPERYDGISEWQCPHCRIREGRWTHKRLADDEAEKRFGGK